jgi:t-SNARE complex subunit (syntaxin)
LEEGTVDRGAAVAEKQQKIIAGKLEMKQLQEAEYLSDVINQRQNDLNAVEGLMDDINSIAKTLHVNTANQGQTLLKVVDNVDVAHTNAVDAHKNIEKASEHQKSGNKWLCWILLIIGGLAVFVIVMLVIMHWGK